MRKKVLFIHQNLPGQFRHLLALLSRRDDIELRAVSDVANVSPTLGAALGVRVDSYRYDARASGQGGECVDRLAATVRRGLVVADVLRSMKLGGFTPDLIYAHPGWGEALFVADVFPTAQLVTYCEFYYQSKGADVGFDPEFPAELQPEISLSVRNMPLASSQVASDFGIAPTRWQRSTFPASLSRGIHVVHDGIDCSSVRPRPDASIRLSRDGVVLTSNMEVVTYVARNLEPYRGFHTFMRSLPRLLDARPNAHVVIAGNDGVSYGEKLSSGTYRERYLAEIHGCVDPKRIHFVGKVPYDVYLKILQVSTVHVYLTYPFVLSWSMLEAMAAGCVVVASDTAPVREFIDGDNGWLVDFFSPQALAAKVALACAERSSLLPMRIRARETIYEGYDLRRVALPKQLDLLGLQSTGRY